MKPVDHYIFNLKEPYQSIMLYVRQLAFNCLPDLEERFSYKVPFYYYHKKPLFYLNVLKGKSYVDVAFMQGLILEKDFPVLKNDNNRKQVRSLQIKSLETFNIDIFKQLLHAASLLHA